jgi:hypothetical protein
MQRSATESDAMPDQPLSATVLIRKPEVLRRLGNIDNSTLSRWVKAGQFPEPVIPRRALCALARGAADLPVNA